MNLDEAEAASREFVAGLDRTPLGRFAIDSDVLSAMDLMQRVVTSIVVPVGDRLPSGVASNRLAAALRDAGLDTSLDCSRDCAAEVFFWWGVTDESLWSSSVPDSLESRVERLRAVYDNPSMHDYFGAGIWDVALVGKLMREGISPDSIDAELARSLSA